MGYGSSVIMTGIFSQYGTKLDHESIVANSILARDYKGFGKQSQNGVINGNK